MERKKREMVGLKSMTLEQRRAYNREATARYREKKLIGKVKVNPERPVELRCSRCKNIFPFTSEFFREGDNHAWGLAKRCKECEYIAATTLAVRRKYGLTYEQYKELMEKGCAICGRKLKRMAMDHCHESGNTRDVLCSRCNTGLGNFEDDPDRMRKAAAYVELHRMLR